eukprot:TRINITY_DN4298_c0_g1_i1.p1 TRINITY_DN4298_c0_g1~~TRINITY_DN4298_c0_g1_i1.p1  ORF type:complete len:382 (-),score=85.13 TRINITY_DN4298_c0_g1_i1:71-1216(-)
MSVLIPPSPTTPMFSNRGSYPNSPRINAPTPPPVPAKLTKRPSKKWAPVEIESAPDFSHYSFDPEWRFDHEAAQPLNVDQIDWTSIVGLACSEEGSDGVFFVETKNGSFVLKGSTTIGADLFTYKLAVRFGIPEPKMKVISYASNEWPKMANELQKFESHLNSDSAVASPLGKCLQKTFLCAMELSSGKDMENLEIEEAEKIFKNPKMLKELGRLIAFDMFINNWDRLPCVWDNEGNPKNILFNVSDASMDAIDTSVTSISPDQFLENFQNYFHRVQSLMSSVYSHAENIPSEILKLGDFIHQYTQCQLDSSDFEHLREGLEEAGKQIASITEKELEAMKEEVWNEVKDTLEVAQFTPECIGFNRVNIQFLTEMTKAFQPL